MRVFMFVFCGLSNVAYRRQDLQRSRTLAARGRLLSAEASNGPYGSHFWAEVAERVPGRTAGECLDAYLLEHSPPVSPLSASVTHIPEAKSVYG
jgi:hypothetical protein